LTADVYIYNYICLFVYIIYQPMALDIKISECVIVIWIDMWRL